MHQKLPQPEAMLFDLDGTLFKTETLLIPAYHSTFNQLRKEKLFVGETPPDEHILSSLGLLLEQIWKNVMPHESEQTHRRADELLLHYQTEGLKAGIGELYPNVRFTLTKLHKKGIRLFTASNGLEDYVKGVAQYKGISPLFEGLYSAGEYHTKSKVDLVRLLLTNYQIKSAWMVGDRSSDVEAGKKNNILVIGCDYAGFGSPRELDGSDYILQTFSEILDL